MRPIGFEFSGAGGGEDTLADGSAGGDLLGKSCRLKDMPRAFGPTYVSGFLAGDAIVSSLSGRSSASTGDGLLGGGDADDRRSDMLGAPLGVVPCLDERAFLTTKLAEEWRSRVYFSLRVSMTRLGLVSPPGLDVIGLLAGGESSRILYSETVLCMRGRLTELSGTSSSSSASREP